MGALLAAAVLDGVDRFVIGLLAAHPAIPLSGLLAVDIILILHPRLITEELFKLLGHFSLA